MRYSIILASFMIITALISYSCEKPEPIVPQEEFTSLKYVLEPQNGGDQVVLWASDPDGKGGNFPTITVDTFLRNHIYIGMMTFYDESDTSAVDVTPIINEFAEEYQVFYLSDGISTNISYIDIDAKGNPIGLSTILTTGENNGNLSIVLRLRPDKGGLGVNNGNITNAGGVTELEVNLPILIE